MHKGSFSGISFWRTRSRTRATIRRARRGLGGRLLVAFAVTAPRIILATIVAVIIVIIRQRCTRCRPSGFLADNVGGRQLAPAKGLLGSAKVVQFIVVRVVCAIRDVGILAESAAKANALLVARGRRLGRTAIVAKGTTRIIHVAAPQTDPVARTKDRIVEQLLRALVRLVAFLLAIETRFATGRMCIWTLQSEGEKHATDKTDTYVSSEMANGATFITRIWLDIRHTEKLGYFEPNEKHSTMTDGAAEQPEQPVADDCDVTIDAGGFGKIRVELYWEHAPNTCKNFYELAKRGTPARHRRRSNARFL